MTLVLAKRIPLRSADFRIHAKQCILRSQAQRKTTYDFAECRIFWRWIVFFHKNLIFGIHNCGIWVATVSRID